MTEKVLSGLSNHTRWQLAYSRGPRKPAEQGKCFAASPALPASYPLQQLFKWPPIKHYNGRRNNGYYYLSAVCVCVSEWVLVYHTVANYNAGWWNTIYILLPLRDQFIWVKGRDIWHIFILSLAAFPPLKSWNITLSIYDKTFVSQFDPSSHGWSKAATER